MDETFDREHLERLYAAAQRFSVEPKICPGCGEGFYSTEDEPIRAKLSNGGEVVFDENSTDKVRGLSIDALWFDEGDIEYLHCPTPVGEGWYWYKFSEE